MMSVASKVSPPVQLTLAKIVIGPAIATFFLLAVLIGLGVWQVERLQWKNRLLAEIDRAEVQPAAPLSARPLPFEKVTVSGRWSPVVGYYGVDVRETLAGSRMGSQLIAALLRPGRPALLVVLGWIVDGASIVLPAGEIHLTGYVRPAEHHGWLSAGDDPGKRRFFTLDPAKIGSAFALDVEPFTVIALQDGGVSGGVTTFQPVPAVGLPRPLNNHLSYAATWFGLAATLVVVFGVWVRKQLPT